MTIAKVEKFLAKDRVTINTSGASSYMNSQKKEDLSKVEVAIFDLDDTLVPFIKAQAAYVETLTKALVRDTGFSEEEITSGLKDYFKKENAYNIRQGHYFKPNKKRYEYHLLWDKIEGLNNGNAKLKKVMEKPFFAKALDEADVAFEKALKPDESVVDTLKELKKRGLRLYIYSEGGADDTIRKLECTGLANLFNGIYAPPDMNFNGKGEKVPLPTKSKTWQKVTLINRYPKSSLSNIKKIISDILPNEKFEKAAKKVVMVGDNAMRDAWMARQVGANGIATLFYKQQITSEDLKSIEKICTLPTPLMISHKKWNILSKTESVPTITNLTALKELLPKKVGQNFRSMISKRNKERS